MEKFVPNKKEIGDKGEALAVEFLLGRGFRILETNWKYKHLEIDIIAMDRNQLVIVEVKTRLNSQFGAPEEFVDLKKQKFLIKAANHYIEQHNVDAETRFDIISVIHSGQQPQISHIPDAFYPTLR
ncbi:MAG: YraN family protein [Bacteroidetes bacterium]|nr:YraN family protein [Bacteroidota bacterium]